MQAIMIIIIIIIIIVVVVVVVIIYYIISQSFSCLGWPHYFLMILQNNHDIKLI